jgi:hypothetical protein
MKLHIGSIKYSLIVASALVIALVLFFMFITRSADAVQTTSQPRNTNLDLLAIMEDAPITNRQYRVAIQIQTDYRITNIKSYYFSPSSASLTFLHEKTHSRTNALDISFQHAPSTDEYLVLHLTYGPNFVFDKYSEAVCVVEFKAAQLFEPLRCDTQTTAEYLVALSFLDEIPSDVINYPGLVQLLQVKSLPQIESYQNYLALFSLLQGHLAESPQYSQVSLPGKFIETLVPVARDIRDEFIKRRRLDVDTFEAILQSADLSMITMAYRLYMSFENLHQRHAKHLPDVIERKSYLKQFLSGFASLALHDPDAFQLANVVVFNNRLSFSRWPWMDTVKLSYGEESITTQDLTYKFAEDTSLDYAFIRPYGSNSRFPIQKIPLKTTLDTNGLAVTTTSRLDAIIDNLNKQVIGKEDRIKENDNAPKE